MFWRSWWCLGPANGSPNRRSSCALHEPGRENCDFCLSPAGWGDRTKRTDWPRCLPAVWSGPTHALPPLEFSMARPRPTTGLSWRYCLATVGLIAVWAARGLGAEPAVDADFFEKKIRPVLVEHCYECHSSQSEKLKGKLLLDTREAVRKGGESGPAV